jgi:hypothetical protein
MRDERFVMTVGSVDQLVDLLLEDLVVEIS